MGARSAPALRLPKPLPSLGRLRLAHWIVLCAILMAAAVAAGAGFLISSLHGRALTEAKRELQNLTVVLVEQTDRAFQSIELVQTGIVDRLQALGRGSAEEFAGILSSQETHELLNDKLTGLPHAASLSIFDADGALINHSRTWPARIVTEAERTRFAALFADPRDFFISGPVQDGDTKIWYLYVAQKFAGPNGERAGFIVAEIELAQLESVYAKLVVGEGGSVSLFSRDAILLARYPRAEPSLGKSYAETSVFRGVLAHADRGVIRQTSRIDGKDRLIATRSSAMYPVVVNATNTMDAALVEWWREARHLFGLATLIGCVLVGLGLLGVRQLKAQEQLAKAHAEKIEADGARAVAEAEVQLLRERKQAAEALERHYEALRQREEELRIQNLRFDAALSNMSQGLAMFDRAHRLVVCNARYGEVYGLPPELMAPGTTQRQILEYRVAAGVHAGPDPERYVRDRVANATKGRPTDSLLELADGRILAVAHRPLPDGGWVSTHEDITERRRAEARIAHMAHHDALTELPNRVLFRQRMHEALARARRGEALAVLCLDLDQFKSVNDTLGHPTGDALLKAVAERLGRCLRETDTVARLGGDEFAILQVGAEQPEGAGGLAKRLVEIVGEAYELDGHQVVVGTSIGIALAPTDGGDPDQLLKAADLALYRAKADGRGRYRFFEAEMDARMQARRALELDLRRALVTGEFELYYQPLINLESDRVTGFEALLRWRHPERGMVPPGDFIPLAEEIGLIVPLGEWVIRRACAEAATWPEDVKVAVNLSPAQFKSRNLVPAVVGALASAGLASSRLELEITESVLLQDDEANLATLHRLRELGVRISLDDFGTGYSSLSYLRSFPFDKIKIDQSFVRELSSRSDCAAIVRAVASLGSTLGMATTAEGVETAEQLARLKQEGCTEVQGYFFSPPRPAKDVAALLAGRDGRADGLRKAG